MSRKKRKSRKLKSFMFTFTFVTFLVLGCWTGILLAGDYLVDDTQLVELQQAVSQESSDYVRIDDMPDYVWKAFIAVEDHRFKRHGGVDLIGLVRSLWVNTLEGRLAQGGSTITMQLSRNLFLTHEKEMSRKIKEMIIAIHLERQFSKEQLLELYLNRIYFGHGKNGIEAAANGYFGKTVRVDGAGKETVTLSEAALLAALPKAPEHYSPIKDLEKARERRDLVLLRMEEVGFITEGEAETAIQQDVNIVSPVDSGNAVSGQEQRCYSNPTSLRNFLAKPFSSSA